MLKPWVEELPSMWDAGSFLNRNYDLCLYIKCVSPGIAKEGVLAQKI